MIQVLYLVAGGVFTLAFIPQIVKLWKDKTGAASVSISSWGMFSACSVVTLIYATQANHDPNFVMTALAGTVGNCMVLALAVWRRTTNN